MLDIITDNLDVWTTAQKNKKAVGRGSSKKQEAYGIKKLRELILELAVRGKLVPQNISDEPASVLLERIAEEKARLIEEGTIKKQKVLPEISLDEKPFFIPELWEWSRLSCVYYSISPSGKKLKTTDVLEAGEFPVVDQGKSHITGYSNDKNLLIEIPGPVIIFGDHTTARKYIDFNFVAGADGTKILRPYFMNERYFHLYLLNYDLENRGYARHFKVLNDNLIAIPPLAEQHRIVAKVDELMALCDQLEQQQSDQSATHQTLVKTLLNGLIESAKTSTNDQQSTADFFNQLIAQHFDTLFTTEQSIDQLKQTILQLAVMGKLVPQDPKDEPASVLLEKIRLIEAGQIKKQKALPEIGEDERQYYLAKGWMWARMADICTLITDGTHQTPKYTESGRVFISAQNVKPFKFMPDKHRWVSEEDYQSYVKNRKPEQWDILLTRVGAGIGEATVIDTKLEFAIYVSVGLLKPSKGNIFHDYLVCWLNSPLGRKFSEKNTLGKGVSQGNLNLSLIRNFVVSIPPIAEQHRIVKKVNQLLTLCDTLKANLNQAQTTQTQLADAIVKQAVN